MHYELVTHAILPCLLAAEVARLLGARVPLRFDSWDAALETIGELAADEPLALVLDEFQWLKAAQPALDSMREEQEIRDPATYFAVVRAIAAGSTRVSEIANAVQLPVPNLVKMLSRLETLGYLEARAPLGPGGLERKRSSYRLADPFFRFWFRFVFPNRSMLERERVKEAMQVVERDMDVYMGPAFEDCCREWVGRYAGDAFPASQQIGAWWSRDGQVEIDIAGVSRGRYDLLASCKWSAKAPASALEQLVAQRDALPKASSARLAIFARGFSRALQRRAGAEGVALIEIDRLFS